jgi:hypothetical protein
MFESPRRESVAISITIPALSVLPPPGTHVEAFFELRQSAAVAALTVAVHAVHVVADAGRYGALDIGDGRVRGFFEKKPSGPGSINAGAYLLSRELLARYNLPRAFSFETDFLVPHVQEVRASFSERKGSSSISTCRRIRPGPKTSSTSGIDVRPEASFHIRNTKPR